MFTRPHIAIAGVLLLSLLLTDNPFSGFVRLRNGASAVIKNFSSVETQYNTPYSGEGSLPAQVADLVALLRQHDIQAFVLHAGVYGENLEDYQTINVAAWPSLVRAEARHQVRPAGDPGSCPEMGRAGEVVLVHCAE